MPLSTRHNRLLAIVCLSRYKSSRKVLHCAMDVVLEVWAGLEKTPIASNQQSWAKLDFTTNPLRSKKAAMVISKVIRALKEDLRRGSQPKYLAAANLFMSGFHVVIYAG